MVVKLFHPQNSRIRSLKFSAFVPMVPHCACPCWARIHGFCSARQPNCTSTTCMYIYCAHAVYMSNYLCINISNEVFLLCSANSKPANSTRITHKAPATWGAHRHGTGVTQTHGTLQAPHSQPTAALFYSVLRQPKSRLKKYDRK